MDHVRCAICGSDDVSEIDDQSIGICRVRNVQCQRCGHVYIDPRASEQEYASFYQEGFSKEYRGLTADQESMKALADNGRRKAEVTLRFLGKHFRNGDRVLEIGAGFGALLAAARDRYGASMVEGIEPDPQGAVVAKEAFGIELQTKTLEKYVEENSGKQFDFVLMHHVLEHLLDPASAGQTLDRLVAPNGRIYVGVPNVSSPAFPRRLFFRFPHVQSFTPFSLSLFLLRHGFKIVDYDSLVRPLSVIAVRFEAEMNMSDLFTFIRVSLPPHRVQRRIAYFNIIHSIRLYIKNIRGAIPHSMKVRFRKFLRHQVEGL